MRQSLPAILVVDKSKATGQWFQKQLGKEFKILHAASCKAAAPLLASEELDLIVLDDRLPELKKFAYCKHLHRTHHHGHLAVLLMSKTEDLEYFHKALRAGVADILQKPLTTFNVRKSIYLALQFQYKLLSMGNMLSDFKRMAHHDALTHLYNRHILQNLGVKEVAKARRNRHSLSLLMLDIDHFKRVNSNYGHIIGDDILSQFGRLLSANLRAYDLIVRYGGEEFVVILPHTGLKQAKVVADKLRHYIEGYPFFNGKGFFHLSCSIGISHLGRGAKTLDDLLAQGDKAMLLAKKKGRNRVVTHRPKK
jgi:diguanylate cyclase (GGDEF)-like protein